jgi:enoyl-[acyl-carrier protein] reductase II
MGRMFKTRVCELLDIEYPILQGGMAWVATAELAAAVSEAGGLGIIGAGGMPAEILREEIRKARSLTGKPFGVNIMLMSEFVEEQMRVVLEEKPAVITTGAGNPGVYIPDLKSAGIKVIPVVASVSLAIRLERIGVDALIAEGSESGGHIGEVSTFALVPQVVDAVSLPVIAAGGIADGKGFLAAFALGAEGVQMGTRFVCSTECTVHPAYKEAIIKARDRDTVVTGRPTGHPVRCLRNKLTRKFEELEARCAPAEELEELGRGRLRAAAVEGDVEYGSVMAGEISGLIKDIKPVKKIIEDIMKEAKELLANLNSKYGGCDD